MIKIVGRILLSNRLLNIALLTGLILSLIGFNLRYNNKPGDISEPLQTILISLTVTVCVFIIATLVRTMIDVIDHMRMDGHYTGYAYKSDEKNDPLNFYTRVDKPQSNAALNYRGNNTYDLIVDAKVQESDLSWFGDVKMLSTNMADIAWWYTDDKPRDSIGYKRAVFVNDKLGSKFVIFSDDNSIHGRELFVKDKSKTSK